MTGFTDDLLQQLEDAHKPAIVAATCLLNGARCTGFVVSIRPCVIFTVSHFVRTLTEPGILMGPGRFVVTFYEDQTTYAAENIGYRIEDDIIILICQDPSSPCNPLLFVPPDQPLKNSTSLWSISHPVGRYYRMSSGRVRFPSFVVGEQDLYSKNLNMFDHDLQMFQGSSGAPIMLGDGRVVGMQLTELLDNYHAICIAHSHRLEAVQMYTLPFNQYSQAIVNLNIHRCNLKQGVHVRYLDHIIKCKIYQGNGVDNNLGLNEYIRQSTIVWMNSRQLAPKSSTSSASGSTSSVSISRKRSTSVMDPDDQIINEQQQLQRQQKQQMQNLQQQQVQHQQPQQLQHQQPQQLQHPQHLSRQVEEDAGATFKSQFRYYVRRKR